MAIKEAVLVLCFIILPLTTEALRLIRPEVISTDSVEIREGSDEICLKEELKEDIAAIMRRLEDLAAKVESCGRRQNGSSCPANWVKHGKSCYYIHDAPTKRWFDARQKCQAMGADLPIIRSQEENQFILDLLKGQNDRVGIVGAWLRLQRKAESRFYWVDSSPLHGHYQNWAIGEPNNAKRNENCVFLYDIDGAGPAGQWNDDPCDLTAGYSYWYKRALLTICQKPI